MYNINQQFILEFLYSYTALLSLLNRNYLKLKKQLIAK